MKNTAKANTTTVGVMIFDEIIEFTYLSDVNILLKYIPPKK